MRRTALLPTFLLVFFLFHGGPAAAGPAHRQAMQSVCVNLQGNGLLFPAHIGSLIAIFERDLYPKVFIGGCSGADLVAFIRNLLDNSSIKNTGIRDPSGAALSTTRKAALILAASFPVTETILYLPDFRDMLTPFLNFGAANFMLARNMGLWSRPGTKVVHMESNVGQMMLLAGFCRNADFSDALRQTDLKKRVSIVRELWYRYADPMPLTADELFRALLTPPSRAGARAAAIKERWYKTLGSSDSDPENAPEKRLARHDRFLETHPSLVKMIPVNYLIRRLNYVLMKVQTRPFMGATMPKPGEIFYLPDPDRMWAAYHGVLPDGKRIEFPGSIIIHTSARMARRNILGTLVDKRGIENLFQNYYVSDDLAKEYRTHFSTASPMSYTTPDGKLVEILPRRSVFISHRQTFPMALRASVSEPGFFERDVMPVDDDNVMPEMAPGEKIIANGGGWFDIIAMTSLGSLSACREADYIIHIGTTPEVGEFQLNLLRSVFLSIPETIYRDTSPASLRNDKNTTALAVFYRKLAKFLTYNLSFKGRIGSIHITPPYNAPSSLAGPDKKKMDLVLSNNITALTMMGYEFTTGTLNRTEGIRSPGIKNVSPSFGSDVFKNFSAMRSEKELLSTLDDIFY